MTTDVISLSKLGFASTSRDKANVPLSHKTNSCQDNAVAEGKVVTKIMSMWNNVKYGWTVKVKASFSKDSPVWLLGKCYHRKIDSCESACDASNKEEGIEAFKADFLSRVWLTYRREFPLLNGSNFTTDCGWGCMLRSGQMLMAQALVCHFLGRDWRWIADQEIVTQKQFRDSTYHRNIIKWFGDSPSHNSPFSIHTLVMLGEDSGKRAGDWYGPNSVAHMLRKAVELGAPRTAELGNLAVYVAQDCAVYIEDVIRECKWSGLEDRGQQASKSLLLLIPLRLGMEKINIAYSYCLTAMLSLSHCTGIIGGRPKHSLYFVGYQDDKLIHLDPHYCQPVVDVWQHDFPLSTFHCQLPRKMNVSKLDPSCCIGFYCRNLQDFMDFVENVKQYLIPNGSMSEYPMFVFCEGQSCNALRTQRFSIPDGPQSGSRDTDNELECEEFEIV